MSNKQPLQLNDIITVSIVEDDPVIREHLALVLNSSERMRCISTYADAETAKDALPGDEPDVAILDIGLPGITGIELLKNIAETMKHTDFIMLTVSEDSENVFESICHGATGYLVKETSPEMILRAIEDVKNGGSPMSSSIARMIVSSFRQPSKDVMLTEREHEVLQHLCEGGSYSTISEKLYVSGNTVRAHIKSIYKKLQVHTRAEVVKKAIRDGLV